MMHHTTTWPRRAVLQAVPAGLAASVMSMPAEAQTVPYSAGHERPRLSAPANATDCHHHIYDHHFPVFRGAVLRPPDASVDDYRKLQQRLGLGRNVVVQPSTYGTDNGLLVVSLEKFGANARGVAVVDTEVTDEELRGLARAGVRGIRFNLVQAGATTLEMMEPLSRRIEPLGWHVQAHMLGDQIAAAEGILTRLPVPVVFDHMGRLPQPEGVRHPAFRVIAGMVEKGRAFVKLSGAYMDTRIGPPSYADTGAVAKAFVRLAPERMLWGTDWPHPTETEKPDDALLFDLLAEWAPAETTRQQILVDNPAEVYGFPKNS
jgi:predicted TIM-barrel fold metal-dependent hydrolase